jgi:hypothetical protein
MNVTNLKARWSMLILENLRPCKKHFNENGWNNGGERDG